MFVHKPRLKPRYIPDIRINYTRYALILSSSNKCRSSLWSRVSTLFLSGAVGDDGVVQLVLEDLVWDCQLLVLLSLTQIGFGRGTKLGVFHVTVCLLILLLSLYFSRPSIHNRLTLLIVQFRGSSLPSLHMGSWDRENNDNRLSTCSSQWEILEQGRCLIASASPPELKEGSRMGVQSQYIVSSQGTRFSQKLMFATKIMTPDSSCSVSKKSIIIYFMKFSGYVYRVSRECRVISYYIQSWCYGSSYLFLLSFLMVCSRQIGLHLSATMV